jgi:hypothetical protein
MAKRPAIEVEGLRDFKRMVRKINDQELREELKEANYNAAKIVADEAASRAPVRTGRLANSVRANRAVAYGAVKAGSAARVPYAGPIHYGWPARGIEGKPFINEAVTEKLGEARKDYQKRIRKLASKLTGRRVP